MRRSKIKPSINLASRRSVSVTPQTTDKASIGTPKPAGDTPMSTRSTPKPAPVSARSKQSEDRTKSLEVLEETNGIADSNNDNAQSKAVNSEVDNTDTTVEPDQLSTSQGGGNQSNLTSTRRRRFSAVPNVGQPRLRPSSSSSQKQSAAYVRMAGKEVDKPQPAEVEESRPITGPPPIQRVLATIVAKKQSNAMSPAAITPSAKQPTSHSKTRELRTTIPSQSASTPASVVRTTAAEATPSGEGKGPEGDKQRSGHSSNKVTNVYSKKLKELKDRMYDETPSKRRQRYGKRSVSPDRTKMTMSDLIYYNPKTNRMKMSEAEKLNKRAKSEGNQKKRVSFVSNIGDDEGEDDDDDNENSVDQMAPRVKIGPDGNIIIDQTSLFKEASAAKTFDPSDSDVIHEDSSTTTYSSFTKRTRTATWTPKENQKFYKALSAVGTDFSTITAMFPHRTRGQIKRKFKREERMNRAKVDTALRDRRELDMSLFEQSAESEEETTAAKKNAKLTDKKRGKTSKQDENEVDRHTEEMVVELGQDDEGTETTHDAQESQDENDEELNIANILSMTRSGRQPKVRASFTIEIPPKQHRKRTRASPSQKPSTLKVFDTYDQHRIQRLQQQREAVLAAKRRASEQESIEEEEEDDEDGRSEATSEMVSEIASEMGDADLDGNHHSDTGVHNNLQPVRIVVRDNPLGGLVNIQSPGSFQPASAANHTLKMFVITTPDGKQSLLQVNVPASDILPALQSGDVRMPIREGVHGMQEAVQNQLNSPGSSLTTLTNVSSPYQRNQLQNTRTAASPKHDQPHRQPHAVTVGKIIDGKILFSPSTHNTVTTSATMPAMPNGEVNFTPRVNAIVQPQDSLPSYHSGMPVQHLTQPAEHLLHDSQAMQDAFASQQLEQLAQMVQAETFATKTTVVTTPLPPEEQCNNAMSDVVVEIDSTGHLLAGPSLADLDVNVAFTTSHDMIAYGDSIIDMNVAQQVDVASSDPDGSFPPRSKQKRRSHGPFIPSFK